MNHPLPLIRDLTKVREYNLTRLELIETIKLCLNNIENITNPNLMSEILSDLLYLQKCKKLETNTHRQFEFIHESRIKKNMNILIELIIKNNEAIAEESVVAIGTFHATPSSSATDLLWAQMALRKLNNLFEQMSIFTWDCSDSERIILRDIPNSYRLKHTAPLNPDEAIDSIFPFTRKYGIGRRQTRGRTRGRTRQKKGKK